ncbi:MAG: prephenate dehydrogenase/arogenate dehydrogenase family protein [Candidatus Gracilibacteria bacterium]|nr:prephenate dehydrogenase/arogenate dehydrogenase family protein [Candidatus Gracilibacteria bacterium]
MLPNNLKNNLTPTEGKTFRSGLQIQTSRAKDGNFGFPPPREGQIGKLLLYSLFHIPYTFFMQKKNPIIGIIGGRGVLGSIFRKEFENLGYKVIISGRKPSGKVLKNSDLVKQADIVIVSVFLADTPEVIREITPLLKPNQLLCDFTSIKSEAVKLMLESKAEVVGLHPMFGKVESVNGFNIFACVARSKTWWKWLKPTLEKMGLKVHEVTPEIHDKFAALHQSVPHLFSIAFARLLEKRGINPEKLFEVSSPSTKLELLIEGRLLNQSAEMYADIQLLNPETRKAASEFEEIFHELAAAVREGKREVIVGNINSAAKHFGDWKEFAFEETNRFFGDVVKMGKPIVKAFDKPLSQKISANKAIAILGPATQTEIAAADFLKKQKLSLSPLWKNTMSDVFTAVAKGEAQLGFIPLENYTIGPVRETVNNLFEARGKIRIVAEIVKPIAHALLGKKDLKPKEVSRIFAHSQVKAQCAHFLQKNFPGVEIVETPSTGESVLRVASEANSLAIGPVEAAGNGVKILKRNVEDDPNNRTRFVVIALEKNKKSFSKVKHKTVLTFYFRENIAGQLAKALTIFAENNISLSRIESIPAEKRLGEFFFFTECVVADTDKRFQKAVKQLSKIASVLNLGSY